MIVLLVYVVLYMGIKTHVNLKLSRQDFKTLVSVRGQSDAFHLNAVLFG